MVMMTMVKMVTLPPKMPAHETTTPPCTKATMAFGDRPLCKNDALTCCRCVKSVMRRCNDDDGNADSVWKRRCFLPEDGGGQRRCGHGRTFLLPVTTLLLVSTAMKLMLRRILQLQPHRAEWSRCSAGGGCTSEVERRP